MTQMTRSSTFLIENDIKKEFTFFLLPSLPTDIKLMIIHESLKRYCILCHKNETDVSVCEKCVLYTDPIYGHLYLWKKSDVMVSENVSRNISHDCKHCCDISDTSIIVHHK